MGTRDQAANQPAPEGLFDEARAAFERGDYLSARKWAQATLQALAELPGEDPNEPPGRDNESLAPGPTERDLIEPDLAERAQDLLERLRPDPLIRYLLGATALLLLFLAIFAYGQGRP